MITNPTATVLVNGLGIFCQNDREKSIDFGFLEVIAANHPFRLKIYDFGSIVWDSQDEPRNYFDNAIITIRKSIASDSYVYRNREGQRNDPKDYDWMLDLKEHIYHQNVEFITPTTSSIFAKLVIKNATFYTYLKSERNARFTLASGPDAPDPEPRQVGRVMGADILCQQSGTDDMYVDIRWLHDARQPRSISLPRDQGPYIISIDYKCIPSDEDDFPRIYDLVRPPDGRRYNLRFESPEQDWTFRGFIGNRSSKYYIDECHITDQIKPHFPENRRRYFDTAHEADQARFFRFPGTPAVDSEADVDSDSEADVDAKATTRTVTDYACQVAGGGTGGGGVPFP